MIKFIYIIAFLYILFYDLKLSRYADQSTKKIIRNVIYGLTLLIASLYLRSEPLGPRSSVYITLIYGLSPLLTLIAIVLLIALLVKYGKTLFQTVQDLLKSKWNIFEIVVLTGLLFATAVDTSLWSFMGTFATLGVLIVREAFIVSLKRNNEAGA